MQDKPLHIDEKFTSKAWADMSLLLDMEMPLQPEKRRRVFGWWWFALLGISVVAGATYMVLGKKTKTEVPSKQPIASATLPSASSETTVQNSIATTERISNSGGGSNPSNPEVFNKSKAPIYQGDKSLMKSQSYIVTEKKTETTVESIEVNNSSFLQLDNIDLISADKLSANELVDGIRMDSPDFLAQVSMNPLLKSNENSLLVVNNFTEKEQWEWALQASGIAIPNLSGGGFAIGANAIKTFSNKRVNISFGLGYSLLSQPIYAYTVTPTNSVNSAAFDNSIVYENSDKTAAEIYDSSYGVSRNNQSLKLHYLTAPIQISYRLTNRLNVKTGISAGILLASQSGYTTDGILKGFAGSKSDESFGLSTKSKIAIFDMATTAGIGLVCSPKLSLQLDYVHGMTDVLPKNNVGDFNRLLKLGVSYKLSRRH